MKKPIRSKMTVKASSIHDSTNIYDRAGTHERTTTPPRIFRPLFQTKDSPSLGRRSSELMSRPTSEFIDKFMSHRLPHFTILHSRSHNHSLNLTFNTFLILLFSFSFIITAIGTISGISSNNTFATTSTLSIAVNDIVSLNLGNTSNGVLVGSTSTTDTTISVNTTNATGYTLSIAASTGTAGTPVPLSNIDSGCTTNCTIPSITTATSTNDASSLTTGTWGYFPSKFNSTTNTVYRPAPTVEGDILDVTNAANASSNSSDNNNYNIAIGAKLDYTNTTPGTYSSAFIVTAIANATSYTITYNANAGSDTVTNMPANITNGSTYAETVQLSSNTPVRDAYNFLGWCTVQTTDGQACSDAGGASYALSSNWTIDQTSSTNTLTLYAVWESAIVTYTQTVNYYYQTATGTTGTMMTYTEDVEEGSNFTFTYAKAASFNSTTHSTTMYTANNGTTTKTINYTVTGPTTNTVYFNRKTRTVTLTKGAGISAVTVTGTGVKSGSGTASATVYYGGTATIAATLESSIYSWVNWTGSATYTNRSQSISNITTNRSFTANTSCSGTKTLPTDTGIMQTWSKPSSLMSYCEGASTTLTDNRSGNIQYTVAKIGDLVWMTKNLDLPGGVTIYKTDSNITADSYTLPASSTSGFSNYSTAYVYNSDSTNFNDTSCGSNDPCYSYYSYAAATAGTNPSSGAAFSDICPKGWRLPTQAELTTLKNSYKNLVASPFLGVRAGIYYNGSFSLGGSRGDYWSSTTYDAFNAYYLNFNSSSASVGYCAKDFGYSVRCVAK